MRRWVPCIHLLDCEHYAQTGGDVRIVTTRDLKVVDGEYCWAEHKLYNSTLEQAKQYRIVEKVLHRLFDPQELRKVADVLDDGNGKCRICSK